VGKKKHQRTRKKQTPISWKRGTGLLRLARRQRKELEGGKRGETEGEGGGRKKTKKEMPKTLFTQIRTKDEEKREEGDTGKTEGIFRHTKEQTRNSDTGPSKIETSTPERTEEKKKKSSPRTNSKKKVDAALHELASQTREKKHKR